MAMLTEIQQQRTLLRLIREAEEGLAQLTSAPWESELGYALGDHPITRFVQAVTPALVRRWIERLVDADNTIHHLRQELETAQRVAAHLQFELSSCHCDDY